MGEKARFISHFAVGRVIKLSEVVISLQILEMIFVFSVIFYIFAT